MKILVVGTSIVDLFLNIEDPKCVEVYDNKVTLKLGDKIPTQVSKLSLGGGGSNLSVGIKRLGVDVSFYTYLGQDALSAHIEKILRQEGVDLLVQRGEIKDISLSIILDFKTDRIIFAHYPVKNYTFELKENKPDVVLLSSIGDKWEGAYESVLKFVKGCNLPLVFLPGSHQINEINDLFFEVLRYSDYLFVNKEEAEKILRAKGEVFQDTFEMLSKLKDLGVKTVSVTDGENGAYVTDGTSYYKIKALGRKVIEKTGVGDSYASGFLAARFLGKDVKDSMKWGVLNASSVITCVGAQDGLLNKEQMEDLLRENLELRVETM